MSSALLNSKTRINSIDGLKDCGMSMDGHVDDFRELQSHYDVGVTGHVLSQIDDYDAPYSDVVGRQYVPSVEELSVKPDEENDPIGDDVYSPMRGIVHRYSDRALLKISNVCAVYCRYCFRREMIGAGSEHMSDDDFYAAIGYISSHPEIKEVILTGGDPLVLSARRFGKILDALSAIDHLKVIRIHTKIPVVNPSKIDKTLLSVLKASDKVLYMVVHINHAREISDAMRSAIFKIRMSNVSVFSQSVLLKGVNDDPEILVQLFRELTWMHVNPYYLHHLDRAKGTSHFRVPIERGKEIMRQLQGNVSGISLPKYMLDIPGGHGKIPINDESVHRLEEGVYRVTDYQGCTHLYFENMEEAS
jgi:lysine 2,3-aminomutase